MMRLSPTQQGCVSARARPHWGAGVSLRCLVALIWLLLPLRGHGEVAGGAGPGAGAPSGLAASRALAAQAGGEERRVIVQLEAPAAAAAFGPQLGADGGPGLRAEVSAYLSELEAAQAASATEIASAAPGAEIVARYGLALNGLAVRLPGTEEETLAALLSLPGVRAVFEEVTYRPALYSSLEMAGVPASWADLGGQDQAGAGVRIAVLDNGIDVTHPMFAPETFTYPEGYPLGDERYATAKVIAARAYFRPTDPPLEGEAAPVPGPFASGHGTHVAGVAAGLPVTATVDGLSQAISGVAPRAYLMNYRIFYPSEDTSGEEARSAEVLEALEDAVADGADVILSSWVSASPRLPYATAEAAAVQAAIDAGIVVVSAAGNDGPAYGSASRLLGGYDPTIAVGAVTKTPVITHNNLDVTGPGDVPEFLRDIPLGVALFGATLDAVFGPAPYVDVADIDGGAFALACQPLPAGSLEGWIALIERGECPFADKVYYAQQAGAVAVVIQNTDETVMDFACSGGFCDAGEIGIPAVMVTQSAGEDLVSWRTLYPAAALQIDPTGRLAETLPGVVWENSVRGPAFMRYLKPDVVAPGVAVLSASHDPTAEGGPYAQITGTSVAAAHAAGAAALLLQANPGWGHAEVKAALMATAGIDGLWADSEALEPANLLSRGAGLIDVAAAASPPLLVAPPSVSLPEVRAGRTYTVSLVVTDPRASGDAVTFTPSVSVTGMISVTVVGAVRVAPGETATVPVRVAVNTGAGAGDATADLWLAAGEEVVHVPLWAHVAPATEAADVLLIDNDFSNFDTFVDYARIITPALEALPYSYAYWDADLRFDNAQTIPDLSTLERYPIIVWLTGDNKSPFGTFVVDTPLTPIDLQLLADYLDGGGRLLAIGQNLAEASDVNPDPDPTFGRADLYHHYLGARWLQGNVFAPNDAVERPPSAEIAVVGVADSYMNPVAVDLGQEGDGEGNQTSIDEVAPGGLPDGSDLDLVAPILQEVNARPVGAGYVGVAKWDDPTIEDRGRDIGYRTTHLAFGVEGINEREGLTSRAALLDRALDWLSDAVTVDLLPTSAGVRDLTELEASATSSVGSPMVQYRWQIASGDEVLETATSTEPMITFGFPEAGDYAVTVEAMDALGHTAVDEALVTAVLGGSSALEVDRAEAAPGDELVYRATLRNTGPVTITMAFTLPVPAGASYVSHAGTGATFDGDANTLTFAGPVGPDATRQLQLTVRIDEDATPGTVIAARGDFVVDSQAFERTVRTVVRTRTWFPAVTRSGTIP